MIVLALIAGVLSLLVALTWLWVALAWQRRVDVALAVSSMPLACENVCDPQTEPAHDLVDTLTGIAAISGSTP